MELLVLPSPISNPQFVPKPQTVILNPCFKFPTSTRASDASVSKASIPTMPDIIAASKSQNLDLQLHKLGPFFRITAQNSSTGVELGRAEGMIRFWSDGKILHLDTIKLRRETLTMERSIFGIALFIGAVAFRYGFDCGCTKAELLAINDSEVYHSKLVRFYRRLGFKEVYEVTGSSIGDLGHMLVWGGVGTRMDANVQQLLLKWGAKFKLAQQ